MTRRAPVTSADVRFPLPAADASASPGSAVDPVTGFRFAVVAHTHWDREWYLPFEHFRMRLARTIDEIVEVLESDTRFRSFTLDGQSVTLEDYAEVRPPEAVERLRRLVADGRVMTGPSYVLPDEFLAGQEALVRNLIAGRRVVDAWGGHSMEVGYLPDTFGHVGQLPQILRGFGLDAFIFWRGLDDRAGRVGLAFEWQAPDGSSVTAIRQVGSYGNAAELGRWGPGGVDLADDPDAQPGAAAARLDRFLDAWGPEIERTGTRELLLCNGSDHLPIHRPLPDLVEQARARHPDARVEIGSYDEYWGRLRPTLGELPAIRGELVGGRDAPVLRGINSARIYLKQAAERTERALLAAESFASLASLAGRYDVPVRELRLAWREHLRNLPHDSISGCSVDEVHRDMAQRFVTAQRIADRVRREALAALAGRTEPWTYRTPVDASFSVVNPLPSARRVLVEVPVPDELVEAETLVAVPGFAVEASEPAAVASALPIQRSQVALTTAPSGVLARFVADIEGFGARTFTLASVPATASAPRDGAWAVGPDTIENEHLRVTAHGDGSLTVVELATGRTHERLNVLEDEADRGDEYNFCPLDGDRVRRPNAGGTVQVGSSGPVVAELVIDLPFELPAGLSVDRRRRAGRVACPVRVRVGLIAGVARIAIETSIDNRAEDHRLRVRFRAPDAVHSSPVRAEGHFDVVHRPARPSWSGAGWIEPPAFTSHTSGAVAVGDLVVVGAGLPEYEAIPVRRGLDLAVTLLRCVGWLSRDDLSTRPAHAGPGIATPEAQCPGRHTFSYAIAFGAAALTDAAVCRLSADVRTPVGRGPAGSLTDGLLAVDGDVGWSALKPAEDGDGVILRIHAPGAPTRLDVRSIGELSAVRLDEAATREDPLAPLKPGEVRTIRIARR
ncbi:MAG TPA: hypothetical protein VFI28_10300 [Candidatus Limnocylindrales bacterium]|nr:hypothetical protein [Candidatus Limnocylindrales bacterium]